MPQSTGKSQCEEFISSFFQLRRPYHPPLQNVAAVTIASLRLDGFSIATASQYGTRINIKKLVHIQAHVNVSRLLNFLMNISLLPCSCSENLSAMCLVFCPP